MVDPESRPPYRRIARFLAQFRTTLCIGLFLMLLASAAFALLPWPIRYLIDGAILGDHVDLGPFGTFPAETSAEKLWLAGGLAAAYLAIQSFAALLSAAGFYAFAHAALHMIHELRGQMLAHLRTLSLGFHANRSTGDLIFRAINDARAIQEVVILGLQVWVFPLFQLALMVALMLALDPMLTIVALAITPLMVLAIRALTGRIQSTSAESRGHMSRLTALIEQTMNSIRAVQVFGKEASEHERFEETSFQFISAQLRFRMSEQALMIATMLITGLATAAVLWFAADRVIGGVLSIGALWIFLSYLQRIYELLQRNMSMYGMLQDALVGVGRAFSVLDTPPEIADRSNARPIREFQHAIGIENVSLRYDEGPVLRNVSITVGRGEQVALVGATGSGKTSVLNLIPRLYDASEGCVRIDGVDVRDLELASLRELVSMVPQEPLLFAASVRDNIRYGRLDAGDDEIEAAARAARADEFIEALTEGWDTPVGERGARLSIGQQQRIALARAFLKDAPILLLDEPTSALDSRTESDLLTSIQDLMAGRTVVIVAHRLRAIRGADRIVVIDHGAVAEEGVHHELIARGGLYTDLWNSQFGTIAREDAGAARA